MVCSSNGSKILRSLLRRASVGDGAALLRKMEMACPIQSKLCTNAIFPFNRRYLHLSLSDSQDFMTGFTGLRRFRKDEVHGVFQLRTIPEREV